MTINPEVPYLDDEGHLATPSVLAQIDARTDARMRGQLPALADELGIGGSDTLTLYTGTTLDIGTPDAGRMVGILAQADGTVAGVDVLTGQTWVFVGDGTQWTGYQAGGSGGGTGGSVLLAKPTASVSSVADKSVALAYSTTTAGATAWQYRLNGGAAAALDGTSPDTITGLTPSTDYTAEVRYTVDGAEWSVWSTPAAFKTDAPAPSYIRFNAATNNSAGWADNASTLLAVYATENGVATKNTDAWGDTNRSATGYTYVESDVPVVTGDKNNTAATFSHILWPALDDNITTKIGLTGDGSITLPFSGRTGGATSSVAGVGFMDGTTKTMMVTANTAIGANYGILDATSNLTAGYTNANITVATIPAGANDWMRFNRTGDVVKVEISKDSGATWQTLATKSGASTAKLNFEISGYKYTLTKPSTTGVWS